MCDGPPCATASASVVVLHAVSEVNLGGNLSAPESDPVLTSRHPPTTVEVAMAMLSLHFFLPCGGLST